MEDVITLVAETVTGKDAYGNEQITTESRVLLCDVYSVSRNEFYAAATAGLKPDLTVRLSNFADYEGEKIAVFHDETYDIIRTYQGRSSYKAVDADSLELILQKRVGNG